MLKNKTKIMVLLLAFLLMFSTFCFATEGEPTPTSEETNTITSTAPGDNARVEEGTEPEPTPEIYSGDLYVFDNNIEMDQLVDGNVFLFGDHINVTGKVNGSLYACGNNVTFAKDSYVVQSIYVMANTVTLNGNANDLYAFARKVDMSYDSFMIRDLKVFADTFNFNGGVGRDAFVEANNFNFSNSTDKSAIVYGNLTYSASKELSLSNELVQGEVHYQKALDSKESVTEVILEKVISACNAILYTLVVFLLCLWLAPKFLNNTSSTITVSNIFRSFGIGLLTILLASMVSIGLLFTFIGIPLGFAIAALLVLLLSISGAISSICITYKLKEKFAYSKKYLTYLTLIGVVVAIWALSLIPYVGWVISFVVKMFGLGTIIYYLLTNKKSNNIAEKE